MKSDFIKPRLAIIGTAGVPGKYGGFETLAHHLVLHLGLHYRIRVYCSGKLYARSERQPYWNGAQLTYLPLSANGLQSIFYDYLSILHALFVADTILILGVSGCTLLPLVRLFSRKKIIVNIDGLEWRREKWSTPVRIFLKLSEMLAVRYSDADITDNLSIQRYTARYYKTLSHLITYGADHCNAEPVTQPLFERYPFLCSRYACKVARIEPENNIHLVLEAFETIHGFPLVVVGNWNNSEYGRFLKSKYGGKANYFLLDPIYEVHALNAIRSNCYVYIHGHSAGGTNPSLVEAMYLGVPVLALGVSYNRSTTNNKALYFSTVQELRSLLLQHDTLPLAEIGRALQLIATRQYRWSHIAGLYHHLIQVVAQGHKRRQVQSRLSTRPAKTLIAQQLAHLKNSVPFYE